MAVKELFKSFVHKTYLKIAGINDSPLKIALGFGIGVFLGIFPGMGPIASVVAAMIFRVNKAAALIGSLFTNTWLSFVVLGLATQIGAKIVGQNQQELRLNWERVTTDFHFKNLCGGHVLELALPILAGFVVVSFAIGALAALLAYGLLRMRKQKEING